MIGLDTDTHLKNIEGGPHAPTSIQTSHSLSWCVWICVNYGYNFELVSEAQRTESKRFALPTRPAYRPDVEFAIANKGAAIWGMVSSLYLDHDCFEVLKFSSQAQDIVPERPVRQHRCNPMPIHIWIKWKQTRSPSPPPLCVNISTLSIK